MCVGGGANKHTGSKMIDPNELRDPQLVGLVLLGHGR